MTCIPTHAFDLGREMSYRSSYMSTAYGSTPRGRFYGSALREEIQADIDRARARIRRHVPYHPSYVPRVFEIAGMWRSAQAPSDFWRNVAPPHYFGTASRVSNEVFELHCLDLGAFDVF